MSNPNETPEQNALKHHQELLATYRERLAILLEQQAHFGAYAPPHIITEIRATQEALRPLKVWLRSQDVIVADEPNDDVQIGAESAPSHLPGTPTQTINNQTPNQGAQGIFYGPVSFGSTRQDDERRKR